MKSLKTILSKNSNFHSLNEIVQENLKFKINRDTKGYEYQPKSWDELRQIIEERFKRQGAGITQEPINFNDIDVSKMITFYNEIDHLSIFENSNFEYIDISNWDVSNVENMARLFFACRNLKSVGDLSNWNVSNAKDMNFMFYECGELESIGDLSNWDVSSVENMRSMFFGCEQLKSIGDLSNWNISNVKIMDSVFSYCKNLKSVGNLSKWDVSNVEDMKWIFNRCENLKTIGDISNWDISNDKDTKYMFLNSAIINKPDWYEE